MLATASIAGAQTCGDPNGDGLIDVIDAANVLRAAVSLPTEITCPAPEITDVVNDAEIDGGGPGVLAFRITPIPRARGHS